MADGVEIVRNVSGARWGDRAALVEVLAIGKETGAGAYLFGSIDAAWATPDRIYVIDGQVPIVRAFDRDGRHVVDFGRPGQGPGEYGLPASLAVTADGRLVVADAMGSRLNIYGFDGTIIEDWPLQGQKSALDLTIAGDGRLFTSSWSVEAGRLGVQPVGADGLLGELRFPPAGEFDPPTVSAGKGLEMVVPFAPAFAWTFAPGGEMIGGAGDAYRFRIERDDGSATVVERAWSPVPINDAEASFHARVASASLRSMSPELGIDRADIPATKPAFRRFHADRSGRVWLLRQGPGQPDPTCSAAHSSVPRLIMLTAAGTDFEVAGKPGRFDPDGPAALDGACWRDTLLFDVFDLSSGEFLGSLDAPEPGLQVLLFAERNMALASVLDEAGTLRLKLYELRLGGSALGDSR